MFELKITGFNLKILNIFYTEILRDLRAFVVKNDFR